MGTEKEKGKFSKLISVVVLIFIAVSSLTMTDTAEKDHKEALTEVTEFMDAGDFEAAIDRLEEYWEKYSLSEDKELADLYAQCFESQGQYMKAAEVVIEHNDFVGTFELQARTLSSEEKNLIPKDVKEFVAVSGNGLQAKNKNDELIFAGKLDFVQQTVQVPAQMIKLSEDLSLHGKTVLFFGMQNKFYGIIAVADTIRSDSAKAIEELKKLGITVIMLSGDNKKTAKVMADKAGVDKVIAGVLPDGKEKVIKDLQKYGKVCMVGDGINDAPALTTADIGIAIGTGTDIAIDAADVVLMNNNLLDVAKAIRLSRGTLKNITQNLFWAFIYNIIGIPLAAGIWIYAFGWKLNPMFGAAAMSFSSFCVVTNALRLNLLNINSSKKDKKIKEINSIQLQIMEDESMEKSIKIEGMMCGHCSGRVKKCLEATAGIANADVSHETGIALVRMDSDVSNEVLTKIIEDEGYKVLEIK